MLNRSTSSELVSLYFDSKPTSVLCHMGDFGCGDGGWTPVMKIDGRKVRQKRAAYSRQSFLELQVMTRGKRLWSPLDMNRVPSFSLCDSKSKRFKTYDCETKNVQTWALEVNKGLSELWCHFMLKKQRHIFLDLPMISNLNHADNDEMIKYNKKIAKSTSIGNRKSRFLRGLRHSLIWKICFDVTNIIVSYLIFQKPLGLYNS